MRQYHKSVVEKALSQGKPVPAEVLKDYPGLGKVEGPKSDLRKGYDEKASVIGGTLYRKGNTIQVWWDKQGKETWTSQGYADARENFDDMKERWGPKPEPTPKPQGAVPNLIQQEADKLAKIHASPEYKKAQADWQEARQKYGLHAKETLALRDKLLNLTTPGGIVKVSQQPEVAIPKASPGMPEAGLQLDISGKTTAVMPKGKGKPVTASMESYAKLQKVRAEESPKEIFGTLSQEDASELVAGLDLRIDALEGRIDEGKATLEGIKESVNPKVAKLTALIPATREGKGEITHITKGQYRKVWGREPKANILTKDGKSVRWEYALDEIAQELHLEPIAQAEGKAPDEYLKGLIEEAKDTKELIRATESEVRSDESTLKALGKLKDTIKARTGKVTDGKLLEKLAKAPRITVTTKPKPAIRAKTILAGVAQSLIEKTQAKRAPRAIAIDNSLLAKTVVSVSKVELWAKHPNRLDIRGIDTPSRSRQGKGVYADKGQSRMSRKPHRNWKRIY